MSEQIIPELIEEPISANCVLIVPAAGVGSRFGADKPKQCVDLNNVPILVHALRAFEELPEIKTIVLSLSPDWHLFIENRLYEFGLRKIKFIVEGGKERQDSVMNALKLDAVKNADIVLVHDSVRPFPSQRLIRDVIKNTLEHGAAIPAIVPTNTIKETDAQGFVAKTFMRSTLRSVQTPQGFAPDILIKSYAKAVKDRFVGTDDSSLVENAGYSVKIVEGEDTNIKITTPADMKLAEIIQYLDSKIHQPV